MDLFFQALDCWYEARQRDPAKTPNHNVKIKIIVGASAGGLNTAIAAVCAPHRFPYAVHHRFEDRHRNHGNPFYRAWVRDIDITNLLQTDDLKPDAETASVLNSAYLDRKVESYLSFTGDGRAEPATRAWLEDPLPVKITTSNLDGVRYRVGFTSDRDEAAVRRPTRCRSIAITWRSSARCSQARQPLECPTMRCCRSRTAPPIRYGIDSARRLSLRSRFPSRSRSAGWSGRAPTTITASPFRSRSRSSSTASRFPARRQSRFSTSPSTAV
jgi:hypothetical protein